VKRFLSADGLLSVMSTLPTGLLVVTEGLLSKEVLIEWPLVAKGLLPAKELLSAGHVLAYWVLLVKGLLTPEALQLAGLYNWLLPVY
jgi:hypothetical protein